MADALQGTWVFNDIVNLEDADYIVNFSSNGINFTELYVELTALETLWGGIIYKSDSANREAYGLINKQVQWADKAYKTITITSKLSEVTGGETLLTWLQANATKQSSISFKHFFCNSPIGSGTIRFRPYTVAEPLPQLATVSNVSVEGTTVTFDEVENATSYEVLADGESIGTVENGSEEDALAGTWVFNDTLDFSSISIDLNDSVDFNITLNSNNAEFVRLALSNEETDSYGNVHALYYSEIVDEGMPPAPRIVYSDTAVPDYDISIGWQDEAYKTITITSKLSEVTDGETLLAWLQDNATKQ